ncbi:MAG: response regulator [Erysipelotrichaceae bacterium]|nr:response regulator [Erysipelotrichaceae bacterium]
MNNLNRDEILDYLDKSKTGYWKLEMLNGVAIRMYVDKNMQYLIGAPDGLSPEECCQFFINHIHPEDQALMVPYGEEMMRGNAEVVYRYLHPSNGEIMVTCGGRRIKNDGDVAIIIGYHKEMADTIHIENNHGKEEEIMRRSRDIQMKENQEFYFSLMDKASCGMLVYTLSDHKIIYMNSEALRVYGADTVEEVQNSFVNHKYVEADLASLKQMQRLKNEDVSVNYECTIHGLKGCVYNVLAHSEVITSLLGERCAFTTFLDVSENKTLRSQYDIINSVSQMFDCLYYVDLKDSSYIELGNTNDNVTNVISKRGDAKEAFDNMLKYLVNAKDVNEIRDFVNLDTLNERMGQRPWISCQFLGLSQGWFEGVFISADRDEYNNCHHVIWGVKNIHEQKRRELAYEEENRKTSEVMDAAGMGIWEISLFENEEPKMKANEKMRELLHLPSSINDETEIYNAWFSRVKKESLESVLNSVEEMKKGNRDENTYLWDDPLLGDQYVRCGGYGEKIEGKGFILRGYHYNVNEEVLRSQKEQLIRQKLADFKLKTVSEAIHGGFKIGKNDPQFTFKMVSEQLAHLLGYDSPEELMEFSGGCMSGIVNHEDTAKAMPEAMASVSRNEMYTMHYRMRCKDGSWKNVEDRGRLITNEKGEQEFWSFISDQDQLRELENANKAKTAFLFNMSHDIRTPMNAILGYSQMMKKELKDPLLLDYQSKIEQSGNLLLSIINNVLDMARIESGKTELEEEPNEVGPAVIETINVFDVEAKKKNITVTYNFDVKHNYVLCDETKISEIFTNLISNAIKYTPNGGKVNISVTELESDKEGYGLYKSVVSDTGIGMSEEFQEKLYDAFSRERNTTIGKVAGTGLGMTIVKKLVDLFEGTIDVDSKPGEGTTFTVIIPHKLCDKETYLASKNFVTKENKNDILRGKKILLAEDNELNAEIAIAILEEEGLIVKHVEDGQKCLEEMINSPVSAYDLILMDIQMPNMDGYEATRRIRTLIEREKANIPIVAMTANAFDEDKRNSLNAGMNGHVAKPINMEELFKILTEILK